MKIKYLLLTLLFTSSSVCSQDFKLFENNKGKTRAYSYPIGSVKIISNKAHESKIKFPLSEKDTEIDIFLNEYNKDKKNYINKKVCDLKFSKGESRFFSIIVDTVKDRTKMLLSTPLFMSEFKIKKEKFKFVFVDSEVREKDTPIVILYYDTPENKLEAKLKSKGLIDDNFHTKDLKSIYNILQPYYTVTIKERTI